MNDKTDDDLDEPAETESSADNDTDEDEARSLLAQLKTEHRRIDQEITALLETGVADMLKVSRMKKIKLSIKDQIVFLENQLTPDIIA